MKSRTRITLAAAAAVAALTVTACGNDSGGSAPTEDAALAVLDGVEVTEGADGAAPSVTLDEEPLTTTETASKVITEGDGDPVADDALVQVDLAMYSGKDGSAIASSETYTTDPTVLDLGNQQILPGLSKAIQGAKVGDHGVAALPPKDVFGEEGNEQLGISGDDTIVLVYDVRAVIPTEASGEEQTLDSDLPEVEWKADAPAEFTMPDGDPPTELVSEDLITGDGAKVKEGDTVYVTYTGALWRNGEVFDSTQSDDRSPFPFQLGGQQVISGWEKGVEGKTVGSRVLLVVPPDEGYGEQGSQDGSITGDDTIVFVVDILAVV